MRKLLPVLVVVLGACSAEGPQGYDPQISDLAAEAYAGATVELAVDPLPDPADPMVVRVGGDSVAWTATASGVTFTLPDTASGATTVQLVVNEVVVWADTIAIAGFAAQKEASEWIGAEWWNLVTTEKAGATTVWGRLTNGGLGTLSPSSGSVVKFDSLMFEGGLRVPGPAAVPGQFVVSPTAAVAADSFEIWQFLPSVQKVGRVPRHGAERQIAMLDADRWLITGAHGAWTYDAALDSVIHFASHSYEEPQVIFRSPRGDRTTFSFHGATLGTPVFGPNGLPVFHVQRMRGVRGVSFSHDSTTMVMVGYAQDYSNLLMEVELEDGTRVDSLTLPYAARGVGMDGFGRVYVLGEGASERPFVEVYQRPGYQKLGRMQAPANVRPCSFQCIDGVLGFDLLARLVYAVDAGNPSNAGGTGNGIWTFRMPMGAPAATMRARTR